MIQIRIDAYEPPTFHPDAGKVLGLIDFASMHPHHGTLDDRDSPTLDLLMMMQLSLGRPGLTTVLMKRVAGPWNPAARLSTSSRGPRS